MQREPALRFSISFTTRKQRPTEQHGRDYFFVSKDEFQRMVDAGEFLEHAQVFDNFYGTARRQVEDALAGGQDLILEIDWQGAGHIRRALPGASRSSSCRRPELSSSVACTAAARTPRRSSSAACATPPRTDPLAGIRPRWSTTIRPCAGELGDRGREGSHPGYRRGSHAAGAYRRKGVTTDRG
jgi:hypothetical protein